MGGLFAVVFITILVLTIPDIPIPLTLAICVPIVVLGPIVGYPFSKTIWVAVDRAFLQQMDVNERTTNRVAASDPVAFLRTRAGAQIDRQGEDAVLERPRGIADDREVLEVELRLLDEPLPLRTRDRRERAPSHGVGTFTETGEHRVDVELIGHGIRTLPGPRDRRTRAPGR